MNNTSPSGMLDLPVSSIKMVEGDDLGGFWHPIAGATEDLPRDDPAQVPLGVQREAYSWGGVARNSIGGSSGAMKVLSGVARVGWTLLLPFGLLNMAYWSRRLMNEGPESATGGWVAAPRKHRSVKRDAHQSWTNAGGAALIRLAALLMTLLLVVSASVVSLDVVGTQCYRDGQHGCTDLPPQLDFLAGWDESHRLALLSLFPLAVLVFLYLLTSVSVVRFTDRVPALTRVNNRGSESDAAYSDPKWPLLRTDGFWNPRLILTKTARLHVAAAAVLVTFLTAWQTGLNGHSDCESPTDVLDGPCWSVVRHSGPRSHTELIIAAVSVVLLLVCVCAVMWLSADSVEIKAVTAIACDARSGPERGTAGKTVLWLVILCGLTFLTQAGVLAVWRDSTVPESAELLGVTAVPSILIAVLLGIGLVLLTSRRSGRTSWRHLRVIPGAAVTVLLLASSVRRWHGVHHVPAILLGVAAAAALLQAGLAFGGRARGRRYEAWRGCAPGVFTIVGLLFATILSSAVVVAVGNLLNGDHSASSLDSSSSSGPTAGIACTTSCPAPHLLVPRPYVWFGAMLLPLLALLVIVLVVVVWRTKAGSTVIPQGATFRSTIDPPSMQELSNLPAIKSQVLHARRFAALTQRAEWYVTIVAALGTAALFGTVAVAVSGWSPTPKGLGTEITWSLGTGMWTLALAGAAIIALATGASNKPKSRPFGLLWDLMCFLPKAAHPFGPPCYAERVVPELVARYDEWLVAPEMTPGTPTASDYQPDRQIVLSAHSLGSVLAVASLLAMVAADDDTSAVKRLEPISLLTYGSQLRAFFGRIFPELLGPDVIGSEPSVAPHLLEKDPWCGGTPKGRARCPGIRETDSVARLLTGDTGIRWINLWRRTDYIGFPVFRYATDVGLIDRLAEEVDESRYLLAVLTHGDYPRAPAYGRALTNLLTGERLEQRSP